MGPLSGVVPADLPDVVFDPGVEEGHSGLSILTVWVLAAFTVFPAVFFACWQGDGLHRLILQLCGGSIIG